MKSLTCFILLALADCLLALALASFLLVYPAHWFICRHIGNSYVKVVLLPYVESLLFLLAYACEAWARMLRKTA